ncbi:MAG: DUF2268 domain-containing putative Zn-dependent protease [Alphaproteobacteria bacterium]|nr:DUF2268 domain-containing putative Zn-dependent protease [Alphaproteobacteria bacterium]
MARKRTTDYSKLPKGTAAHWNKAAYLSPREREILHVGLSRGLGDAARQGINTEHVNVRFRLVEPKRTIPALGVAGFHDFGSIVIDIDKTRIGEPDFSDAVARLVTHECNHEGRTQVGQCPKTLGQSLVFEGLALLAEMAAGHSLDPYFGGIEREQMRLFGTEAKKNLEQVIIGKDNLGFGQWFFGKPRSDGATLPHFGGYVFGAILVRAYCINRQQKPEKIIDLHPEKVVSAWLSGKLDLEKAFSEIKERPSEFLQALNRPLRRMRKLDIRTDIRPPKPLPR